MRDRRQRTNSSYVVRAGRLRGLLGAFLVCLAMPVIEAGTSGQVVRPMPIPGRIEAEDYDTNGPGIFYYDTTPGNSGGVYRSDDVDIQATSDVGGGYNVGWIAAGEWLCYTLSVQQTAVYRLEFRAAAQDSAGAIQASLDGLPLCGVQTPRTGGWQTWQTVSVSNIVLRAGTRLLRLDFSTGGYNLNYVHVTKQSDLAGGFLRVSGKQIVDGQGENVLLRGMGLGNWMLQEPYMMDVSGIAATQQKLKDKISELVGTNNMAAFYSAWHSNAMRLPDIQKLAQSGFNSIRVPMHFNLFTLPVDQEPVPGQNTWLEGGFQLLDNLLAWCETNRIWVILDMHACPGGQGHDQAISDYNPPAPSLWESQANRDKLIALWRELARRYAGREWIGGYDLINEPNWTFEGLGNVNGCDDQTNAPLRQLMMDLTAAIREVDTNHIIFLMGNCWGGNFRGMLPPWDANLVIGFHKYWDSPTLGSLQGWLNMRDQWNMPLWLGESGENSNEWFREVVRIAEQQNIGWAWWPWKKIGTIAGTVMIQKPAGYQRILDYWRGSGLRPSTNEAFASLLDLAQAARFENCVVHRDVFDALLRPNTGGVTLPFKVMTAPGLLFAADYDMGRVGEAFFDNSSSNSYNSGNAYRNDSVDIEGCSDSTPTMGFDVGWLDVGDWMKYTVSPVLPGPYAVHARVACNSSAGSFFLDVGGTNMSGNIVVPVTGGWQNWQTIYAGTIPGTQPLSSFKCVVATNGFNLQWLALQAVPGSGAGLPAGWMDINVGAPALPGSGGANGGTWAVTGGGTNIWGTNDQFHYTFRELSGDGMIVARVTNVTATGSTPKAGIMFRASTNANAPYAFLFVGPASAAFEYRASAGTASASLASSFATPPRWLKLARSGGTFSADVSSDGADWTLLGVRNLTLPATAKAGLAVCANNSAALNTAIFDHVNVLGLPPPLHAVPSGTNVILCWPAAPAGYSLYCTSNLQPPVLWWPITNLPSGADTNLVLSLPTGSDAAFYRLVLSL